MRIIHSHIMRDQHSYIVDNLNLTIKNRRFHTDGKVTRISDDTYKVTGGNYFFAINNGIVLSILKFRERDKGATI